MSGGASYSVSFESIDGPFRLYKAEGAHSRRRQHPSASAAQAEAIRLLEQDPAATFVIAREIGKVSRNG